MKQLVSKYGKPKIAIAIALSVIFLMIVLSTIYSAIQGNHAKQELISVRNELQETFGDRLYCNANSTSAGIPLLNVTNERYFTHSMDCNINLTVDTCQATVGTIQGVLTGSNYQKVNQSINNYENTYTNASVRDDKCISYEKDPEHYYSAPIITVYFSTL